MAELLVWPALLAYGEAAVAYAGGLRGPGRYGRLGIWGVRIGWLAQTALLVAQAATTDGFPWGTWAGALNLLSWLVVTAYLAWGSNPRYRLLGLGVMPVAAVLLALAWAGGGTGVHASEGAGWTLDVHVGLMLAAFASFTVAAAVALLYLFEERRLKRRDARVLRLRLPSLEALDRLAARVALVGLVLLSAGILVGLTRLDTADIDIAMSVTVVLWALYAAALVLRREVGLQGRRLAVVARRRVLAGRRRPPPDPLRIMKLALVGVSHHTASVELRERVAIDPASARRLAHELVHGTAGETRPSSSRPATARSCTSHPPTRRPRAADRALLELAGGMRTPLLRSRIGWPTSRRRCICSASRPASTRSSRARGRSSDRYGMRTRPGRQARCSIARSGWRSTLGGAPGLETAIGESPSSVPAAAAALAQQVFDGLEGRRVVLVGAAGPAS